MTDLIPVPRRHLEALKRWRDNGGYCAMNGRKYVNSTGPAYAAVTNLAAILADPPSGYWLSGEEVETLRTWQAVETSSTSIRVGTSAAAFYDAIAVAERVAAACPEPEQFSDEEIAAAEGVIESCRRSEAWTSGAELLTRLAAAGLYVTDAPR